MEERNDLTAIIDWLEFTVHEYTLSDLITYILELNIDDFSQLKKGKLGYENQLLWNAGNIFILYNQHPEFNKSGIHVIITGTGCRSYETDKSLRNLMINVMGINYTYKFTRIDIAIDDHEGKLINFDRIEKAVEDATIISKWYKADYIKGRTLEDGKIIGQTLYFGKQSSRVFMRVYNKYLEQKAKDERHKRNDDTELTEETKKWTRMEIVYKKERAQMLARYVLDTDNIGDLLKGTLKHYIRFAVSSKTDNNKRRWKTARWYDVLLGRVGKLKLTIKKETKTIEQMEDWINKQITPTLAAVMQAKEGDTEWLISAIINGGSRLKTKHEQAINQHLNNND